MCIHWCQTLKVRMYQMLIVGSVLLTNVGSAFGVGAQKIPVESLGSCAVPACPQNPINYCEMPRLKVVEIPTNCDPGECVGVLIRPVTKNKKLIANVIVAAMCR